MRNTGTLKNQPRLFSSKKTSNVNLRYCNPGKAPSLIEQGKMAIIQNDLEKAIHIFERVLWLDPKNLKAAEVLGGLYENNKYFFKALVLYRKMLRIAPANRRFFYRLSNLEAFMQITKNSDDFYYEIEKTILNAETLIRNLEMDQLVPVEEI